MNIHNSSKSFAMSALAVVALSLLAPSSPARERVSQATGPRGGTLDRDVEASAGNVEKSATYTSPAGKVSTRHASRQADRATGTVTGSAKTTLANGKSASSSYTSVKTDTGRTTTGQATGFNGKTATYNSTSTKTADGFTREATTTGPNGGSVTKDVDVTKQDGSVTRTVMVTKNPPAKP
jgi:hypothetical protein